MRGDDSGKCDPFRHPPIFLRRQTGLLGDTGEWWRRAEEEGGAAAHPLKDDLLLFGREGWEHLTTLANSARVRACAPIVRPLSPGRPRRSECAVRPSPVLRSRELAGIAV